MPALALDFCLESPSIYYTPRSFSNPFQALYEQIIKGRQPSEFFRLQSAFLSADGELNGAAECDDNWDGYGAERPNAVSVANAKAILDELRAADYPPTRIIPSAEGGVAICFVDSDRYADIECLNTGAMLAVMYAGSDEPTVWEVEDDLIGTIKRIQSHFSA